jgi:hypothetical protein
MRLDWFTKAEEFTCEPTSAATANDLAATSSAPDSSPLPRENSAVSLKMTYCGQKIQMNSNSNEFKFKFKFKFRLAAVREKRIRR